MSEETLVPNEAPNVSAPQETPKASATEVNEKVVDKQTAKPQKKSPKKSKAKYYIPLEIGQQLAGKVKTLADFGAFIDLDGTAIDGLVHISAVSRRRVQNIKEVLSEGQEVTVWVKSVDTERGRIGLTMIKPVERRYSDINEGDVLEGEVKRLEGFGVFVDVGLEREGLVHVSELSHEFVKSASEVVSEGDTVNVKVLKVDARKKQVNLSIKALLEAPAKSEEELAEEEYYMEEVDEEPLPTAFGAAFAKIGTPVKQQRRRQIKRRKRNRRMDDVVARTLKNSERNS